MLNFTSVKIYSGSRNMWKTFFLCENFPVNFSIEIESNWAFIPSIIRQIKSHARQAKKHAIFVSGLIFYVTIFSSMNINGLVLSAPNWKKEAIFFYCLSDNIDLFCQLSVTAFFVLSFLILCWAIKKLTFERGGRRRWFVILRDDNSKTCFCLWFLDKII